MKAAVIFFLFLCFHLAGGHNNAHASEHKVLSYHSPGQSIEKNQQLKNAIPDYFLAKCHSLSEEDPNLISIDDEDEDEDIIRKHVSLARYIIAFTHAFILEEPYSYHTDGNSFYHPPSCIGSPKYISQRVLRI